MRFTKILSVLLLGGILLVSGLSVQAQDEAQDKDGQMRGEIGLRFMPTLSNVDFQTSSGGTVSGEATLGFGFGLMAGYNFSDYFGVQGELIYSTITQKVRDADREYKVNLRYVNIPLMVSLNTGKSKFINLNVVAGPQVGFNVGSSLASSGTPDSVNSEPLLSVKKGDVGLAYGAGIDFGLNPDRTFRLALGYRAVLGLLDISNDNNSTTTNSYYILDRAHVNTKAAYIGVSMLF